MIKYTLANLIAGAVVFALLAYFHLPIHARDYLALIFWILVAGNALHYMLFLRRRR